nr:hypothetical protein [Pseudonocardia sp. AL041005-10]
MYLVRYHGVMISPSGVWRILDRLDLNRLPASQRYQRRDRRSRRYGRALFSHRVQIDVTFAEAIPTAADSSPARSKSAPAVEVGNPMGEPTKLAGRRRRLERLPFKVDVIQTHKVAKFQSGFH